MPNNTADWSLPEVVRSLIRLEKGSEAILARLEIIGDVYATKSELATAKEAIGIEIRDLKLAVDHLEQERTADLKAAKRPWTEVASLVVAIVAVAASVVMGVILALVQG